MIDPNVRCTTKNCEGTHKKKRLRKLNEALSGFDYAHMNANHNSDRNDWPLSTDQASLASNKIMHQYNNKDNYLKKETKNNSGIHTDNMQKVNGGVCAEHIQRTMHCAK